MYNHLRNQRERGELTISIRAGRATRPLIRWRVWPTVALVCEIDIVLQVLLPAIKLHLSATQLLLILSMFLLTLVYCIKPQVEAREVVIHVMVEMGFIKAQRTRLSVAPSQRGVITLLLDWCGVGSKTPGNPLTTTNIPTLALRLILIISISILSSYIQLEGSKQVILVGFGRGKGSLPWLFTSAQPPSILNISLLMQVAESSYPLGNNGVNYWMRGSNSQAYTMAEIIAPQATGDLGAEACEAN